MRRREKKNETKYIIYATLFILILLTIIISYLILKHVWSGKTNKFTTPYVQQNSIIEIENKLKKNNLIINSVLEASSSSGIIVTLDNNFTVYFSLNKDIDWQISTLQSIIHRLTIERGGDTLRDKTKIIDFRFDKPIIKF